MLQPSFLLPDPGFASPCTEGAGRLNGLGKEVKFYLKTPLFVRGRRVNQPDIIFFHSSMQKLQPKGMVWALNIWWKTWGCNPKRGDATQSEGLQEAAGEAQSKPSVIWY